MSKVRFLGLDVHADTIAVALAAQSEDREFARDTVQRIERATRNCFEY